MQKDNNIGFVHRYPNQLDKLSSSYNGIDTLLGLFLNTVQRLVEK